jgi:site-specific recombinase XerD
LSELNLTSLNEWVQTWEYATTTHRSRIDLARQFFKFALAHKWVTENPAKGLIKPTESFEPTLPFTPEEEQKIFAAATHFGERRHFDGIWSANPETGRALLLVMRWTGLRASDSVLFEPRDIKSVTVDGRNVAVYGTYQMKTGEYVMCPLPPQRTPKSSRQTWRARAST